MAGRFRWQSGLPLVIVFAALVGQGCGDGGDGLPRESVSGVVTIDGAPLANGAIRFSPSTVSMAGNAVEGGDMIRDGRFSISRDVGLIPGNYNVAIYSGQSKGGRPSADVGPGRGPKAAKELIPAKYNSKSELKADVPKGGLNSLRFDLLSK